MTTSEQLQIAVEALEKIKGLVKKYLADSSQRAVIHSIASETLAAINSMPPQQEDAMRPEHKCKPISKEEILNKIEVEWRHWGDVFSSTAGIYSGSEYLYRPINGEIIRKELMDIGLAYHEAQKEIDNFVKANIHYPQTKPKIK